MADISNANKLGASKMENGDLKLLEAILRVNVPCGVVNWNWSGCCEVAMSRQQVRSNNNFTQMHPRDQAVDSWDS